MFTYPSTRDLNLSTPRRRTPERLFVNSDPTWEQGWSSSESARLLSMRSGLDSRTRGRMRVELICYWFSPLLREVFLRFCSLLKNKRFQIPI